jgi:hypothetical protein
MGQSWCRCSNTIVRAGDDLKTFTVFGRSHLGRNGTARVLTWSFSIAASLGLALADSESARAQDIQPAPSPPSASSPRHDRAPVPPALAPGEPDQKAGEAAQPGEPDQVAPASDDALSLRYRFAEKYGLTEDPAQRYLLWKYKVGIIEAIHTEVEQQQSAPKRDEAVQQIIYTERPARIGRRGEVIEAVRRYDAYKVKGANALQAANPPLFKGLTVWYQRRAIPPPLILTLTENRPLREQEYSGILRHAFLPGLGALLPPTPRRVRESWQIPRAVAQALFSMPADVDNYDLKGTLQSVHKTGSGTEHVAKVDLSGGMTLPDGPCAVNASIEFVFDTPAAPAALPPAAASVPPETGKAAAKTDAGAGRPKRKDESIVDAKGYIQVIRMSHAVRMPAPGGNGRLLQTVKYELTIGRKLLPPSGEQSDMLGIPDPPPVESEANSWLSFDDPDGRFRFRHPQELMHDRKETDRFLLTFSDRSRDTGPDVLFIQLPPGNADPQEDVRFRNLDHYRKNVEEEFQKNGKEFLRGNEGWLKPEDWAPRRVFLKELAIKINAGAEGDTGPRMYGDYYFVLLGGSQCIHVWSLTERNDHPAFRKTVQAIIKSFEFRTPTAAPSQPAAAGPATAQPPR